MIYSLMASYRSFQIFQNPQRYKGAIQDKTMIYTNSIIALYFISTRLSRKKINGSQRQIQLEIR